MRQIHNYVVNFILIINCFELSVSAPTAEIDNDLPQRVAVISYHHRLRNNKNTKGKCN